MATRIVTMICEDKDVPFDSSFITYGVLEAIPGETKEQHSDRCNRAAFEIGKRVIMASSKDTVCVNARDTLMKMDVLNDSEVALLASIGLARVLKQADMALVKAAMAKELGIPLPGGASVATEQDVEDIRKAMEA